MKSATRDKIPVRNCLFFLRATSLNKGMNRPLLLSAMLQYFKCCNNMAGWVL